MSPYLETVCQLEAGLVPVVQLVRVVVVDRLRHEAEEAVPGALVGLVGLVFDNAALAAEEQLQVDIVGQLVASNQGKGGS